jgi:hypothetical protein
MENSYGLPIFPGVVTSSLDSARQKVEKCRQELRKAEELLRLGEEKDALMKNSAQTYIS